jgi:hypothetical protein
MAFRNLVREASQFHTEKIPHKGSLMDNMSKILFQVVKFQLEASLKLSDWDSLDNLFEVKVTTADICTC